MHSWFKMTPWLRQDLVVGMGGSNDDRLAGASFIIKKKKVISSTSRGGKPDACAMAHRAPGSPRSPKTRIRQRNQPRPRSARSLPRDALRGDGPEALRRRKRSIRHVRQRPMRSVRE
jgi:hypothetical protein